MGLDGVAGVVPEGGGSRPTIIMPGEKFSFICLSNDFLLRPPFNVMPRIFCEHPFCTYLRNMHISSVVQLLEKKNLGCFYFLFSIYYLSKITCLILAVRFLRFLLLIVYKWLDEKWFQ